MSSSFWKRTVAIFRDRGSVLMELADGKHVVGEVETIGDNSCSVRLANGATVLVEFKDLKSLEPSVPKL